MATYSSPPSDGSDPVIVSRPSSPALPARPSLEHHDSPAVNPILVKDTPNETVSVLKPGQANTQRGLGQPGQEELSHLRAQPTVPTLGAAEGVVGAAHGTAPEYIARVAKAEGGGVHDVPSSSSMTTSPSYASSIDDHDTLDDGAGGKKQPKWFRKIKENASSAASSIREKAKDLADQASSAASVHSARENSPDIETSSTTVGRERGKSIGSRSAVSFSLADQAPPAAAVRSSLEVPRPAQPPRIVTDGAGHPVPLSVGENLGGGTPTTSSVGDGGSRLGVVADGNVSMATSVRDKMVESGYEVEVRFPSFSLSFFSLFSGCRLTSPVFPLAAQYFARQVPRDLQGHSGGGRAHRGYVSLSCFATCSKSNSTFPRRLPLRSRP
jgi:hypothetical protein